MIYFFEESNRNGIRVDYAEMYEIHIKNINALYLEVGGYNEIQEMNYWKFTTILQTASEINQRKSGKPVTRKKIYKSQQDMINKTKALMG